MDLLAIPYNRPRREIWRTNRNSMSIYNLHDNTRRIPTVMRIEFLRMVQQIHPQLLRLKLLDRRIRFRQFRSQQLPSILTVIRSCPMNNIPKSSPIFPLRHKDHSFATTRFGNHWLRMSTGIHGGSSINKFLECLARVDPDECCGPRSCSA